MPRAITNGEAEFDAPSDARLQELRLLVDSYEQELTEARQNIATAMQASLDDGVSMAHVARTVGWSRQWCYHVISRWLPAHH